MQYTSAFPLIECRKSGKSRHKRVYELLVDLSFLLLNSDKVIVLKERNGRQPIPSFPHQFQNLYFNTLLLQTVNRIEISLPANPKLRQGTGRNLATFLPPQHLHSNSKAQLCVLTQSAPKKKKKRRSTALPLPWDINSNCSPASAKQPKPKQDAGMPLVWSHGVCTEVWDDIWVSSWTGPSSQCIEAVRKCTVQTPSQAVVTVWQLPSSAHLASHSKLAACC